MVYSNYSLFKPILGNSEVTVEKGSRSRPCVYVSDEGGGHKDNTQPTSFRKHLAASVSFWAWGLDSCDCVSIVKELTVNAENRFSGRWLFHWGVQRIHHDTLPVTYHTERSRMEGLGDMGFDLYWQTLPDHLPSASWHHWCAHMSRGSADVKQKTGFV